MRSLSLTISLCLAASVALAGARAASAQDAPEPLKVGFGGALLGSLASYGLSNLYGIEFAIHKANEAGGVLGRQIELVMEDDSCEPALASSAATKLATQGIRLVLGHTCSGATHTALSVYGGNAIVISSSATDIALTDSGDNPLFFRTTPRDDAQSSLQVRLIRSKGFKKIAILHDKGDYGKSLAELADAALKADPDSGIEVVLLEGVTSGQVSYDAIVARLKDSGADAVIWGGYYNDASKLALNMRDRQVAAVIIGADGLYDDRFLSMGGGAVEGSFATGQSDISESEAAREALDYHRRNHTEETGTYFFYAAAAAQALFAAVEKAGSAEDLELIKKHLTEDTADTVLGPVRFDAKGDLIGAGFKLYEVKDGKFAEVTL
ncbi:MAG: branched-chain amino acid ABC transporter substrate-binding protein [Deltaproteobacteria bacterium]|jgi:branched-chain amino acid transport system substrate-binding protein|nr:branched-chain amino acid ABC transporter substrate-binding protein [Deltaproteobacteria bacterium]